MAIIDKRKLIELGPSKVVTIPKGHTLLEKGDVVTIVANNVVAVGPLSWMKNRRKMKEDLKKLLKEL
jgi:Trk K+ transport system NAD-binding subunit